MIFGQRLKITFRKSSVPPEKIQSSLSTHTPLKIQKMQVPSLLANIENFVVLPAESGGGGHYEFKTIIHVGLLFYCVFIQKFECSCQQQQKT